MCAKRERAGALLCYTGTEAVGIFSPSAINSTRMRKTLPCDQDPRTTTTTRMKPTHVTRHLRHPVNAADKGVCRGVGVIKGGLCASGVIHLSSPSRAGLLYHSRHEDAARGRSRIAAADSPAQLTGGPGAGVHGFPGVHGQVVYGQVLYVQRIHVVHYDRGVHDQVVYGQVLYVQRIHVVHYDRGVHDQVVYGEGVHPFHAEDYHLSKNQASDRDRLPGSRRLHAAAGSPGSPPRLVRMNGSGSAWTPWKL
ncbi:intermediate filament protein if [Sarotherodon galilaeus]